MKPKLWRVFPYVERLFAIAVLALIPIGVAAQAASAGHGPSNESPSRFDIFAGYSYLSPHGTVQVLQPTAPSRLIPTTRSTPARS